MVIKNIFIGLLIGIVNASKSYEVTQPTLIILHTNEYRKEFHYYPFTVQLDRCFGCCNTVNDLSNKVSVPKNPEDLYISASNIVTGIN